MWFPNRPQPLSVGGDPRSLTYPDSAVEHPERRFDPIHFLSTEASESSAASNTFVPAYLHKLFRDPNANNHCEAQHETGRCTMTNPAPAERLIVFMADLALPHSGKGVSVALGIGLP